MGSCAEWIYGGEHQGKYWCSTKVDSTGTHVNGEGNYGFCSVECSGAPREFEAVSRFRSSASSSAVSFGGASSSAAARRSRRPFYDDISFMVILQCSEYAQRKQIIF